MDNSNTAMPTAEKTSGGKSYKRLHLPSGYDSVKLARLARKQKDPAVRSRFAALATLYRTRSVAATQAKHGIDAQALSKLKSALGRHGPQGVVEDPRVRKSCAAGIVVPFDTAALEDLADRASATVRPTLLALAAISGGASVESVLTDGTTLSKLRHTLARMNRQGTDSIVLPRKYVIRTRTPRQRVLRLAKAGRTMAEIVGIVKVSPTLAGKWIMDG